MTIQSHIKDKIKLYKRYLKADLITIDAALKELATTDRDGIYWTSGEQNHINRMVIAAIS